MQQVQEKSVIKPEKLNGDTPTTFNPSPLSRVLTVASGVCYGLAGASVALSIGIWNRERLPRLAKKGNRRAWVRNHHKPGDHQVSESQRLGSYVGTLAPTLMVAGKVLTDAAARVVKAEQTRWETARVDKSRMNEFRSRFFGR
jgi:hypothetical protein